MKSLSIYLSFYDLFFRKGKESEGSHSPPNTPLQSPRTRAFSESAAKNREKRVVKNASHSSGDSRNKQGYNPDPVVIAKRRVGMVLEISLKFRRKSIVDKFQMKSWKNFFWRPEPAL